MKIAIDTQTTLGQKSGFGFYNFSKGKISAKPNFYNFSKGKISAKPGERV